MPADEVRLVYHNSLLSRVLMMSCGQSGVYKEKQSFDGPTCDTITAVCTLALTADLFYRRVQQFVETSLRAAACNGTTSEKLALYATTTFVNRQVRRIR